MPEHPAAPPKPFAAAVAALKRALDEKVRGPQGGVRTFFDNYLLRTMAMLNELGPPEAWDGALARLPGPRGERLRGAMARRQAGRFVAYGTRLPALPQANPWPSEIDPPTLAMSQGADACLTWRGLPHFKTAFDTNLYAMLLWELKPRSVIEVGTGTGANALWLADHLRLFGIDGHVHSLDLTPPELQDERVTFLRGDCRRIAEALPASSLERLPHPWLAIEDAHVNVAGVLTHLHAHLRAGDYLIVEDSMDKRGDIAAFLRPAPDAYRVDTRYTDFFGRNATCAIDSIFRRMD